MKKATLLIGAILFSTLFYGKTLGLNLLLFSITTVVILFLSNRHNFKNRSTIIYACLYIATGLSVFFHDSLLSIIANLVTFFTLIGSISEHKSSIYINWLNGIYSSVAGLFHRNYSEDANTQKETPKKDIDYMHITKIIVIPGAIVFIFILLYQNGNPLFEELIDKIDFGFINLQWVLFTVLGYYLYSNIYKPVEVEPATEVDLKTENNLRKSEKFSDPILKKENQLGITLIALLNVLIVIFLITDVTFILTNLDIRASVFSAQVHSGINALIASIIIAIIILLYVFRGDLNFYKDNQIIKRLAFSWILLNAFLILSIAVKNGQYIYYFGLTYKRIGVIIYLILTLTGLATTLIKIDKIRNIWYLFRLNTKAAFIVLVMASMVNWDYHITNYNFNYAQSMDFQYLIELSNNNTFFLKEQIDTNVTHPDSIRQIEYKYNEYVKQLSMHSWQELQYDNLNLNKE
ncbi:DUF4153 domain-containing protein [Winogradskyella sp.]